QTIEINNYPKCEVPFSEIIDNLKSGIYTPITESGFKSWATDDVDNVSNNPDKNGSGDKTDLISAMSTQQECYQLGPLSPNLNPVALPAVKQRIASYTDRGYPIMIYYHIFTKIVLAKNLATQLGWQLADNDTYIKSIGYHALVALNVTDTSGFPNYAFDLQVLDPNDYKLDTLNCSTKIFEIGGPRLAVCTSATMDNEIMDYLSEVEASIIAQAKEAKIYVTLYDDHEYDVIGGSESVYIRTREDKCNAQPSLNFCQQTPVERLSNDIPEIPNRNISTGGGICKAWSYLTLVVAYLGDFNFDFHRGDDKVIGRDCDEIYRYPIPSNIVAEVKKSPLANKVNWLGSIYSSYSNWLGSISGSLSKLWPFK
ncbi:MAG: hypothetical protein NT094_03260, partial [Candidatus Staskawiczbacteria bacterium]|nr:hypothetical protein [Candidatus Staskawiczbacteria bacterium]